MNTFTSLSNHSFRKVVLLCLALTPVVGYAVVIGLLSYNLPIFDDYILWSETADLLASPHWSGKLHILFGQLNEHRLAYTRFWFWAMTVLNGTIPFKAIIWTGNASLLGVGLLFYSQGCRLSVPASVWLPVGWLLYQFQFHVNSLWAMASLQNLTVHFLYLLLFILIVRSDRTWFISACLAATILVYTSGNGFIGPGLCILVLFYQHRYQALRIWLLLLAGLLASYFWGYESAQLAQHSQHIPVFKWLFGVLIFLGLIVKFPFTSPLLIALTGAGLLFAATMLSVSSFRQLVQDDRTRQLTKPAHSLMVVCMLTYGFLLASAVAVVHSRWSMGGWQAMLEVRYCLYSTMWLLTVYVHTVTLCSATDRAWHWQPMVGAVTTLSVIYWVLTLHYNIAGMYEFRDRALSDYYNWTQTKSSKQQKLVAPLFRPSYPEASHLQQITQTVNRLLTPTSIQFASNINRQYINPLSQRPHSELFTISGLRLGKAYDDWRYLVMKSDDHVLLMPVLYTTNTSFGNFWLQGQWFQDDWTAEALRSFTRNQPYRIGLLIKDEETVSLHFSDNYLKP